MNINNMNLIHRIDEYIEVLSKNNLILDIELGGLSKEEVVEHISYDSKMIKKKTLFVIKGAHFKAEYLKEAIDKGSIVYVAEKNVAEEMAKDIKAPRIIVNDIRKTMSYIASLFYNDVWNNINLIGITGTKGKSTTSYFVKEMFDTYCKNIDRNESAIVSGIDNYDGVFREESHLTTPEAFSLYEHFNNSVKSNIDFLTMEVSSQALKYHRTLGITYDIGCFLNIGEDHISDIEHKDFDDYLNSKLLLFSQSKKAVINMDDEYSLEFIKKAKSSSTTQKIITFGLKDESQCDLFGFNVVPGKLGIEFDVRNRDRSFNEHFEIGLPGLFNVSNALAAIAIGISFNIPVSDIREGIKNARVPGRMEVFYDAKRSITIIVDYAHNKLSFESLFASTKEEYPGSEITIVFGCPGNKAKSRRKELAEIASHNGNMIYITEEDHGEESLEDISREIYDNVKRFGGNGVIENNREEAIKKAIYGANKGSVVLITGKGRETRQKRGIMYVDVTSDVEIVKDIISKEI